MQAVFQAAFRWQQVGGPVRTASGFLRLLLMRRAMQRSRTALSDGAGRLPRLHTRSHRREEVPWPVAIDSDEIRSAIWRDASAGAWSVP